MTHSQMLLLNNLKPYFKGWEKTDFNIAKKLNDAVPFTGGFHITNSWRSPQGVGPAGSLHKKTPALALDIVPKAKRLWDVFLILKALGFKRIGLRPDKNMLHVDAGVERGIANEYYFYENKKGKDIGPIENQSDWNLRLIPGYQPYVVRKAAQGLTQLPPRIISAPVKATAALFPLGLIGIASYLLYKLIT